MKKYEYKSVVHLKEVNELAAKGWRLHWVRTEVPKYIMERAIEEYEIST